MAILKVKDKDGNIVDIPAIRGPQGPAGPQPEFDSSKYVNIADVANEANKIPRYNSEGHLILPSGIELW